MMSCTAKMSLRSINMLGPPLGSAKNTNLPIFLHCSNLPTSGTNQSFGVSLLAATVVCSAVQETSASATATETKEIPAAKKEAAPPAPSKRAPPAKAPAKPLPQLMEEDVIPSLKATLEAQEDLSNIELTFQDNKLEGSFLQNGIPYYFWAFFPNGNLTGPKGFSLSSYGTGASTVEPFLIDEKKITAKHVVFWVEKRLAAQGILPVWKE